MGERRGEGREERGGERGGGDGREERGGERGGGDGRRAWWHQGKHADVHTLAECGVFLGLLHRLFSDQFCHSVSCNTLNLG